LKEVFRFVTRLKNNIAPGVEIVWSPCWTGEWNLNLDDYYPGGEYVDVVGASVYMNKYQLGKKWSEEENYNDIVFLAGDNADPVKGFSYLADYKKPLLVSEGGASHTVRTLGEDATNWASSYAKRLYNYLPMVYPQLKGIFWFDTVIPNETNDYALSTNPTIKDDYLKLTQLPRFQGNYVFHKLNEGTLTQGKQSIYTYAHIYKHPNLTLDYYIDNVWIGSSGEIPYKTDADLSAYTPGLHSLRVEAYDNGKLLNSKTYDFNLEGEPVKILSNGLEPVKILLNGSELAFAADPIVTNGITLVPMRGIYEALGQEVIWDDGTITSGNITMRIDDKIMTVGGKEIGLNQPPQLINGYTMVPVRAVSEALGCKVEWNGDTNTVIIDKL
jgi:hypothetical protein